MAEYGSYSIPSGVLDVWERRRNQKRLGGQSYDPLEATAFMKGVMEAELNKQLARRRLAEEKEAKDKALALQELSIANTKDYQDRSLAQQADQFTRAQETAGDVRKDAAEASLINAGLQGAGLLLKGFMSGGPSDRDRVADSVAPLTRASNYFKRTLGGANPGGETGGTTGAASYFSPADTGNAFMTQASAPVSSAPAAPAPAIGSDINAVPSSTYETLTKANQDASLGERPAGTYRMASLDAGTMKDTGAQFAQPAIGSPVSGPDMPGVQTSRTPFETDTGLETINAAEPMFGSSSAASQGMSSDIADIPAYQPPDLPEYEAPTLEPFNYTKPRSAFTEQQWLDWGGEYGKDWKENFDQWQYSKWTEDKKAEQAKYDRWAGEQNLLARQNYDLWAAGENEKAEKAYKDAVKKVEKQLAASKAGQEDGGSPWSFNTKKLGGGPSDEYYGHQFTPASDSVLPAAFDPTGYFAPSAEQRSNYPGYATNFSPAYGNTPHEVLTRFTGGSAGIPSSIVSPGYEPFNYEPPSYSYGSSRSGGYNEPFNYEPAPSYESPYSYSSYEPFNYEPGIYEPFKPDAPPASATAWGTPEVSLSSRGGGLVTSVKLGKIVCTELNRQRYLSDEILAKDSECRMRYIPENVYAGYLTLFGPVVALMRRSKAFTNIVRPFGVMTAREMASRVDPSIKGNSLGKILLRIGIPLCGVVGDAVLNAMAIWARATTEVKHG